MVFKYLRGMTNFAICYYGNSEDVGVDGFINFDWAGEINGRRSANGYVFRLFGGSVNWIRRKQFVVALSSTKAEYIPSHESKEAVWLQRL